MGNFMGFAEYTLSGGNVVFRAWDAARREGLYYVPASGGTVTKIVATGDSLGDGRTIIGNGNGFFQPPIQAGSLSGDELGFRVDFRDPAKGTTGVGIYLTQIQQVNLAQTASYSGVVNRDGICAPPAEMSPYLRRKINDLAPEKKTDFQDEFC
jgi:hypothetical protein